jgi:hypothetical protein
MSEAPLLCAKSAIAPGLKRVVRTPPPPPPMRAPPHCALPCRADRHLTPSVSSRRSLPPSPSVRAPPRRALPCCAGRHLTPYVSSRRSRRVPLFVIAASGPSPQLVSLAQEVLGARSRSSLPPTESSSPLLQHVLGEASLSPHCCRTLFTPGDCKAEASRDPPPRGFHGPTSHGRRRALTGTTAASSSHG